MSKENPPPPSPSPADAADAADADADATEPGIAWFEPLYAAAAAGTGRVPWDRGSPQARLVEWVAAARPAGAGRRAVVVGCGLGDDAELIAQQGFATTAFDVAPTAIALARQRFPQSPVTYEVADLFALPPAWHHAFDLVIESQTLQALPDPLRQRAVPAIAGLVAPGGRLVVIAYGRANPYLPADGPPWPLLRAEIERFGAAGLTEASLSLLPLPASTGLPPTADPGYGQWVATFTRAPAAAPQPA